MIKCVEDYGWEINTLSGIRDFSTRYLELPMGLIFSNVHCFYPVGPVRPEDNVIFSLSLKRAAPSHRLRPGQEYSPGKNLKLNLMYW